MVIKTNPQAINQKEVLPHLERFMGFVESAIEGSCWYRLTRGRESGYTTISFNKRRVSAHRFSYAAFKGDIAEGQEIDHLCRDRACVNPEHLELVTRQENLKRRDTIYEPDAWVGDPLKRLMSRVTKTTNSCWVWNGALVRGYGVININGKTEYVHRVVYAANNASFDSRLTLDHLCRNPRCVNPNHLEPVTRSENTKRMNLVQPKDRCRKGHLYAVHGKTTTGRCIKCYENAPSRIQVIGSPTRPYRKRIRDDDSTHCANGHDYSLVGRFESGNCRKCQAITDAKRGKRSSQKLHEQYCPRGHDTWITGRITKGHCKACIANGFCSNGHDMSVTGKTLKGKCKKCDSIRRDHYGENSKSKQFCPHGHDTFILGRSTAGACKECARVYGREKYGYKNTLADLEEFCKNGHPRNSENTAQKSHVKNGKIVEYKECKTCISMRRKRYEDKKKRSR